MAYLPPMNGGRLNASIGSTLGGTAYGASLISTGTMNLVAGSNITLSQAGANISFSAPNAHNVSLGGNTSGTMAMISTGTLSLYGGNNITLNQSLNNVTINGPTVGGGAGSNTFGMGTLGNSAGTAGVISGSALSFAFAGGGNITLSQSINASSATISINGLPMFDAGVSTMGNTLGATGTNTNGLFLAGSNNITLSQSVNAAGATVNIIGPTFANGNNVSLGISNNGVVTASASFNQSLQTSNVIQAISAGGSMMAAGTMTMSNANGISFGLNNGTLTAAHNALTSQTLQTTNIIQAAAVAGSTLASGSLLFSNANGIGFGLNGSVLTASALSDGIQAVSAGATNITYGGLSFSNANNVNFGIAGSTITASANVAGGGIAVAANANTFSTGTLGFNAGGAISLSTAAQSLTISAPATSNIVGAGGISLSTIGSTISISNAASIARWEHPKEDFNPIASASNGVLSIQHINVPFNVVGTAMKIGGSVSLGSSAVAGSASVNWSVWMGVYTLNVSTLSLVSGYSANNSFSAMNSNGGASSTALTGVTGLRQLTVPVNLSMTPGDYWIAAAISSNTVGTNLNPGFTVYGNAGILSNAAALSSVPAIFTPIGANPSVSARDVYMFQGFHTNLASSASTGPTSIVGSLINNTTNQAAARAAFYHVIFSATY